MTGPDSNGDCSVQFQIPSNSTQDGTLQVEFTLTDTESNTYDVDETNSSFTLDTTKPTLDSAVDPEVDSTGSVLTLTFSEEMYLPCVGIDGFTFTVDGTTTTPSTTYPPEIIADDLTIEFTFDDTIYNNDTVTVAYSPSSISNADNKLRDEAGNLLDSISSTSVDVTNAPTEDTTSPTASNQIGILREVQILMPHLSMKYHLKLVINSRLNFNL